jgi:hypothetical protein
LPPTLTEDQKKLLERVVRFHDGAKDLHLKHEQRWNRFYAQWRVYTDWKRSMIGSSPNDKDQGLRRAKRTWGAQLSIPLVYSVIETQVPRVLGQRPRMQVFPADEVAASNVRNMKGLIDRQQEQIHYELRLAPVAKDGLMYGLGVAKTYWRYEECKRKTLVTPEEAQATVTPEMAAQGIRHFVKDKTVTLFDDPWAESVDPFDFFWDPYAADLEGCDAVIHRTWRSTKYVLERFEAGVWGQPYRGSDGEVPLPELSAEDVESLSGKDKYDQAWADRKKASGHAVSGNAKGGDVHEVWEFHDGDEVIVILDRSIPVAAGPNPYWHGQLPFAIYRPTEAPHEFVGISEVEPMESLQEEMDTLRSQRRDAASLALNPPFAYYQGLVDPSNFKWGLNQAWPVNGDPREVLSQLQVKDVPGSAYQDAAEIQQDMFRAAGLSDAIISGQEQPGGQAETATGAQLVQINLNRRIEEKTKRLEIEVIARQCEQWMCMNQQKIVKPRPFPVQEQTPYGQVGQWKNTKLGPDELAGVFRGAVPEGGSAAPPNTPQMRQDAQVINNLLGQDPHIDQRARLYAVLENLGLKPESMMLPEKPGVPPEVLDKLAARFGQDAVEQAVAAAHRENPMAQPPPAQGQPDQQQAQGAAA